MDQFKDLNSLERAFKFPKQMADVEKRKIEILLQNQDKYTLEQAEAFVTGVGGEIIF